MSCSFWSSSKLSIPLYCMALISPPGFDRVSLSIPLSITICIIHTKFSLIYTNKCIWFSGLTSKNHYSSCCQRFKQHDTDKLMYTSKSYSWENFYSESIHHSNTGNIQNVNKMFGNAAHLLSLLNHQYKHYAKSSSFVVIIGVAIS